MGFTPNGGREYLRKKNVVNTIVTNALAVDFSQLRNEYGGFLNSEGNFAPAHTLILRLVAEW